MKPYLLRMVEMNAASSSAASINHWKELYRSALFELNKDKLPARIAAAEKIIAARARELFNSGDHDILERRELNVALYALVALRSSLSWAKEHHSKSRSAAA
jgi:hypothetical protein